MKKLNLILVYNKEENKILMCKEKNNHIKEKLKQVELYKDKLF